MKGLLRSAPVQGVLALAIFLYIELLIRTLRWRIEGREAVDRAMASPEGVVALFWHGRITEGIACRRLLADKPRRVMISLSRDGRFIARAAERLRIPVIRGSTGRERSDKGGAAAFREALAFIRAGGVMILTPDGPRGPAEVLPVGPARLAAAAAAPTFLMSLAAKPAIRLSSWDRAEIPLPFARAAVVLDGPLPAPGRGDAAAEAARADWQGRMIAGQARAKALLAGASNLLLASREKAAPKGSDKGARDASESPTTAAAGRSRPLIRPPLARRPPSPTSEEGKFKASPALAAYRAATALLEPAAPILLRRRARHGREDPARLGERLGRASTPRPPGRLAWLHGASVGESASLLPLAEELRAARPDAAILVTSGTRAAAEVLSRRLPAGALHQYAPIDTPEAARRFLEQWRPDLSVFAESELWPNLLLAARAGGTRLALLGGRQSEASLRRWRRAPAMARTLLSAFDLILARDEAAAAGLASLGARVAGCADPKLAAPPLPCDAAALGAARAALAGRPMILAASTHPGEEALVLRAWRAASSGAGALLTIAPRHVERAAALAEEARASGWRVGLRSSGDDPASADVYLADTLGEFGLFYRLARLAVLGGSLGPGIGGHNPLEPARLGCPVASGRFVANWPIIEAMARRDALELVDGESDLAALFRRALAQPDAWQGMAERARAFASAREAATRVALAGVVDLLPP